MAKEESSKKSWTILYLIYSINVMLIGLFTFIYVSNRPKEEYKNAYKNKDIDKNPGISIRSFNYSKFLKI